MCRCVCAGAGSTFPLVDGDGRATASRAIDPLTSHEPVVSLLGTESPICHPASTTHSGVPQDVRGQVGIGEGLIRMSIGLEHEDDPIADPDDALRAL